ncbi:MAG: MFS transporter [Bacteroidetes bacterium GWF2_42_66]|nr:MAG: MFS transporter [Bacteroidetes bacterium GWA2_42_15]OFX98725.1 MAG: MFS transporter [Bacteroidetes bacterium GWE2_42_39]OFY43076.1 MAG: MFS transporter [Bacteroidetes bacterium GWF2_42_66]HBL77080.1 MFS transporter [Prolixibacteraceae bacterium]HCU59866.1 MFS transporter [Prolixibacteraceae bacterium]
MKNESSISKILPVLFGFFIMGLVDLVGISTNYVKQDFALSDTLANMLPMTLFLWFAILSVPTGIIMNKLGRKRTVVISMGISLLAMLLPLFSYNFPMILVAFGLLGIGNTIIQVSLNPLLTNVVHDDRLTSSLTLGQFIKAIAAFLGPIIAGVAAGSFGNWKLVFLFFAVVTVISGLWLMLIPIQEEKTNQKSSTFGDSFGLLKDGTILMHFLGIVFVVGIDVGLNTTIPKFLMERCSIPLEQAGLGTSLYFIARTVGSFIGAILLVKLSGRRFFIWSIFVAIPALLVMLLIGNLWGILSMVFIIGFAIANIFSIIFSAALRRLPEYANEISGLLIMGVAGGAIIPLIMGITSDSFGQTGGMSILLIAMAYLTYSAFKLKEN